MDALSDVFIIDPGMTRSFGHNCGYNHAFGQAFAAAGLAVRFFFSNAMPPELLREYPRTSATFAWSLYEEMGRIPPGEDAAFRHSAENFCKEMERYVTPALEPDTLLFAHSLDPMSLLGIALWHAALPERARPVLALNVMLGVDGTPQCRARIEVACALLRGNGAQGRLFGGSKGIGEILSGLMGEACPMLPTPLPARPELYHRRDCSESLLFGLAGDWRTGKNLQILPSALTRYLTKGGQGAFKIQMTPTDKEVHPVVLALHDLGATFPDRITLDVRFLDTEAYYENMAAFDALVIPYTAKSYSRYRPSGLIIESAAMGVPAICAEGGFMEEELAPLENGSLFIPEPSAECLAQALFRFEREGRERKKLALAAAPAYCRYHDIRGFARRMSGRE